MHTWIYTVYVFVQRRSGIILYMCVLTAGKSQSAVPVFHPVLLDQMLYLRKCPYTYICRHSHIPPPPGKDPSISTQQQSIRL